jgi:hypothetical protein
MFGFIIDTDDLVEKKVGRWLVFRDHPVNRCAYGDWIVTAHGITRHLLARLAHDTYLSSIRRALLFAVAPGPGPDRSHGGFMGKLADATWDAHAGGGAGYDCEARVYPPIDRGSAAMFNRTGIRDERILDRPDRLFVAGECYSGNCCCDFLAASQAGILVKQDSRPTRRTAVLGRDWLNFRRVIPQLRTAALGRLGRPAFERWTSRLGRPGALKGNGSSEQWPLRYPVQLSSTP